MAPYPVCWAQTHRVFCRQGFFFATHVVVGSRTNNVPAQKEKVKAKKTNPEMRQKRPCMNGRDGGLGLPFDMMGGVG